MAQFVFKLAAVLRNRQIVETEKQRVFGLARAEKDGIQQEIRTLDDAVRKALADLRGNHLTGVLDLAFLAAHRRFMLSMQRQGLSLIETLQAANQKMEAARLELMEAAKQRKLLEKLSERHRDRWAAALAKKEMAQLDEVSMQMSYQANEHEPEMTT